MEEFKSNKYGNKRNRDDSGLDSVSNAPESKRVHIEANACYGSPESGRVETELELNPYSSESKLVNSVEFDETGADVDVDLDSPEAERIREDILDILDDEEEASEIHDLDSVIKSFEEEILHPHPHQTVVDLTSSDSGESQPGLGYLLEASDDELGLPPTGSSSDNNRIDAEPVEIPVNADGSEIALGVENDLPSFDSFDLGMIAGMTEEDDYAGNGNGNGDFVAVDGLFDYPEPSDFSEFSWRPESLPAL